MASPDILLFKKPAEPYNWESRIPLGNGRLGVMLKGDPCQEGLQLNEENIWSGGPMDRNNPSTLADLPKIRALMKKGKIPEAQEMAFRSMAGSPVNMRCYQNAGDFTIDFFTKKNFGIPGPMQGHIPGDIQNYKMELDMSLGTSTVSYTDDEGTSFIRTTFVSAVDDIIVMHVKADKKGKINFRGNLERGVWADSVWTDGNSIYLEDAHGIPFCAGATVICKGGKKEIMGTCLCGQDVDECIFFISIRAFDNFYGKNHPVNLKDYEEAIRKNTWTGKVKSQLKKITERFSGGAAAFAKEYKKLLSDHVEEFSSYYKRMELNLGVSSSPLSTPKLLENLKKASESGTEKTNDKFLVMNSAFLINQYANFGRYLLISSSRKPGKNPATLQGIWNCYMDPPWGSKYTININLQMNYWCACMCALSETETTVFDLLARGYERGKVTAKKMYGCKGYVMHHNTDVWGDSAPQDAWVPGTYWTLGSGWLATHIWENFEYTLDKKMLSKYYYLIHEACQFYSDFLTESKLKAPDGKPYLILNPSASPENTYRTKDGVVSVFSQGCEMDNQILTHLFESCLKAMNILGTDAKNPNGKNYSSSDRKTFEYVLAHIKKPSLNSDGSIMEWNEEMEEVEPGHRHISHLYGLFPGHSISLEKTPELAEAAKKTLVKRLSAGGGHTGWSQAWIINFRAALHQGEEAGEAVKKILSHSTNPNLLDVHPPFQIDGNFGALSGIIRMLVQSDLSWDENNKPEVKIKLLPALPETDEWKAGSLKGVKVRGDLTLDFEWDNWKVTRTAVSGNTKYEIL
ncbi:MAG: glycoside hydrolase family 95 protein [Treponema sp.]|nr:glycoside hydrolase family 95 protein [Treponema sp.]